MKKIKIAWICYYCDPEIQSKLPLWKLRYEHASYIPTLLRGFEDKNDIEIHVISPQDYLKRSTHLIIRNIHYHFIPYGIPFLHRHWPAIFRFDVFSNFYFFRKKVRRTIKEIQPDIINLMGAENAAYSSSILDYRNKYPILIVIQGFISQMKDVLKLTYYERKRISVEETIMQSFKYYAGEQDSSTYISNYNPNHKFFRVYFPIDESIIPNPYTSNWQYDCVFFGRLSVEKGVADFIKIIAEIKQKKPDVKGCIIGGGDQRPYISLAKELNCLSNIEFTGFINTQEEVFKYVSASKIFLATPYFERLSSTIREAMFLKVPIIAYATGGIPYINEFDENIYLVKTGDYKKVATKAIVLLENEMLRSQLAEKAFQYATKEYRLIANVNHLIDANQTVLFERNIK